MNTHGDENPPGSFRIFDCKENTKEAEFLKNSHTQEHILDVESANRTEVVKLVGNETVD